jgi:hypothetical protein
MRPSASLIALSRETCFCISAAYCSAARRSAWICCSMRRRSASYKFEKEGFKRGRVQEGGEGWAATPTHLTHHAPSCPLPLPYLARISFLLQLGALRLPLPLQLVIRHHALARQLVLILLHAGADLRYKSQGREKK